jgi:hypothetical protein
MPRKFICNNVRAQWREEDLRRAIISVVQGGRSQASAAAAYCIPRETLRRHLKKVSDGEGVVKRLGRNAVLSPDQEEELVDVVKTMEEQLYGLTPTDVRRLVYQYCELNEIKHPFNHEKREAGRDWMEAFLRRHPELSVRKPEPTSLQRAQGFNKPKVQVFFDKLASLLYKNHRRIPESNIYNVDETGFSICHKPQKILALKGKKQVGQLTSAEKGKNITVVCAVSAAGNYVPPAFIFPRVRMKDELMDHSPPGSIGFGSQTGWINEDLFSDWFDHFLHFVKPESSVDPVILVLDGHTSHTKNVAFTLKAKENNVAVISLPSHSTHKMQPLDVSFFKSLNSAYDQLAQVWLRQHPGRAITEGSFVELFYSAYGKAATVRNALSGFRKSGISPFNPQIFGEKDFAASAVTDIQQEMDTTEDIVPESNIGVVSSSSVVPQPSGSRETVVSQTSFSEILKADTTPVCRQRKVNHKRKVNHAEILTSSPYVKKLLEQKLQKKKPQVKKKGKNKKKPVRQQDREDALCIYCTSSFLVTGGKWIQCQNCDDWAHVECAGVSDDQRLFECEFCD